MLKLIPALTTILLFSGCGFLQPVTTPQNQTQQSTQESAEGEIQEPSTDLTTAIDSNLQLYTTTSRDLEGFSTEGAIVTYYHQRETLKKIHIVYFGETGKRINEFYFQDKELATAITTNHNYNNHIMAPDFDEKNTIIESKTIIYPEKTVSKTGDNLMVEANQMVHMLEDPVDESAEWTHYEKDFFSLSYPPEFTVIDEAQDYGTFISPDGTVTISVYSPLWTGTPDKLLPQTEETVVSSKEETTPSNGNELGERTTRTTQWITMEANDSNYTRSILDTRLIGPENSSETRLTWSIQYQDQKSYDLYRDKYVTMKESLIQYAD